MSPLGVGAALAAVALTVVGLAASWAAVAAIGIGLAALVVGAGIHVSRRPTLRLRREIEPPRVEKGRTAIAVVHATNLSRRAIGPLRIEQRIGDRPIPALLPRLRRGESGLRTYRLPTAERGIYEIGPIEVPRADPFGLCRTVQRLGTPQRIAVHPRLLALKSLPTGASRNLEGPSSDTSPQGTVTFHRLREYVVGDDLRAVHWPTTARLGKLVVRHNVDTAQPYSVILLDLRPSVYSEETFESAVDIAASLVVSLAADRAPVQLRTTDGTRLGGLAERDPVPIVDHLTEVAADETGSLTAQLLLLRRDRGGTALVVVTGRADLESLPSIAALGRRFDRVIAVSVVNRKVPGVAHPGLTFFPTTDADALAATWNSRVAP